MSKNHPEIYTKLPNGGYGNKQRDIALLKTKYWQKGRAKRHENSLHLYLHLKPTSHDRINYFPQEHWWTLISGFTSKIIIQPVT